MATSPQEQFWEHSAIELTDFPRELPGIDVAAARIARYSIAGSGGVEGIEDGAKGRVTGLDIGGNCERVRLGGIDMRGRQEDLDV